MKALLMTLFMFATPPAQSAAVEGEVSCPQVFVEITRQFLVDQGYKKLVEKALNSNPSFAAHETSIDLASMKLVSIQDLDPGSYFLNRVVTLSAKLQARTKERNGSLQARRIRLHFVTHGAFECEGEQVLRFTGFEIFTQH